MTARGSYPLIWSVKRIFPLPRDLRPLDGTVTRVLKRPVEVTRTVEVLRLSAEEIARATGETLPLDAVANGQGRWVAIDVYGGRYRIRLDDPIAGQTAEKEAAPEHVRAK